MFCQQELCRQARIEYAEETRKAQELQDKIKTEIAEAKYNKHYGICWEVGCWRAETTKSTDDFASLKLRLIIFFRRSVGRFSLIMRSLSLSISD